MRISIVTVCYNAEKTIADTIQSVRAQQNADFEHIIVDGASRDRTREIVERLGHDRLTLVSEADRGLYDAMNKGAAMARGDLIGFLNSDDFYCRTDALSLIAAAARKHRDAAAISAGLVFVDLDRISHVRRTYGSVGFRRWMLRFGHMPPHPGFYTRTEAFKTVGAFEIDRRIGGDFEWMVRFFHVHGLTAVPLPETIVAMRMGGLSTSGWESARTINAEALRSLNQHKIRSAAALIWSKYLLKAGQFITIKHSFRVPDAVHWKPS